MDMITNLSMNSKLVINVEVFCSIVIEYQRVLDRVAAHIYEVVMLDSRRLLILMNGLVRKTGIAVSV